MIRCHLGVIPDLRVSGYQGGGLLLELDFTGGAQMAQEQGREADYRWVGRCLLPVWPGCHVEC